MRKVIKQKKEAGKFELRYKKIKFIEKRKVIRAIEKINKEIDEAKKNPAHKKKLEEKRQLWHSKLIYINNYPLNWKYISLFASADTPEKQEELEKQRQEHMAKIMQTYSYKI